jgi:hypothetical protein
MVEQAKQRLAELAAERRRVQWSAAGSAAVAAGVPLSVVVHITWSACIASEQRHGHWLGLPEAERVNRLWDRLRRLVKRHGIEQFLAARAPEYDTTKGTHLHLALHLPDAALREVIELIERVTGAPTNQLHLPDGATIRRAGRRLQGVLALGDAGAWLIQKNTRPLIGGEQGFLGYASKAPRSEMVQSQFRLSNDLVALTRLAAA